EQHHGARRRPGVEADDCPGDGARRREPRRVTPDDVVEEPIRVEEIEGDRGDRDRRRDRWKVERRPKEGLAANRGVQDEGGRQAERHLERYDTRRVLEGVLDGDVKDRIDEDLVVVVEAGRALLAE